MINNSLAFVAQGEGGLIIINISDPTKPGIITTVNEGMKGYSYKVARKDSVLYVASGGFGVSVINVIDPDESTND